ncbi:MAG: haloacid dehalogenase type II [Thermaerobacter sp.]|nr:haloacid dehalogenase type II [Thermaerobacter sp.]
MTYRWITFDCYGTLIDWHTGIREALARVTPSLRPEQIESLARDYERVEHALEAETWQPYRTILQTALITLFRNHGLVSPQPADILVQALPTWKPFQEVSAVLTALKDAGHSLAILSNVDRDLIQGSLAQLPVEFDLVVTAEDVGSYKPAPAHWERFLLMTAAEPKEVLHVAAGLHYDIPTAQRLGFRACWINRRGENSNGIQPDAMAPNLTGVFDELLR